jgi:hypothetical protein
LVTSADLRRSSLAANPSLLQRPVQELEQGSRRFTDDGRELLGMHTGGCCWPGGFEVLAVYARDLADPGNADTSELLLWQDANLDGVSQPVELRRASDVVQHIGLGYTDSGKRDQYGTLFRFQGAAVYVATGEVRSVYDVVPAVRR